MKSLIRFLLSIALLAGINLAITYVLNVTFIDFSIPVGILGNLLTASRVISQDL